MRSFSVGAVASVTSGRVLCNLGEPLQVIFYLAGRELSGAEIAEHSSSIVRTMRELFPLFPTSKEVDAAFEIGREAGFTDEHICHLIIAALTSRFGTHVPIPAGMRYDY